MNGPGCDVSLSGALHDVSTAGALFADGIPNPSRGPMAPRTRQSLDEH